MKVKIYPSTCSGQVILPPSKSMAHRAIICASLAEGVSHISNVAYSQDIIATIEGMKQLGADIKENGDTLTITGIKDMTNLKSDEVFCNESGSTLRFFVPIFSLSDKKITFTGKNRLLKRPQKLYEEMFKKQGLYYKQDDEKIEIKGSLKPGLYEIKGDVSSQFISGLLFTLPLLDKDSLIKILPPFESASYISLTLEMLKRFGIKAYFKNELEIVIPGNQKYKACDYSIEGDFSQFAFFGVLGAINSDITCLGLSHDSAQGDKAIVDILKKTNANIEEIENGYIIHKSNLNGCEIDLKDCPDLGPILTVLGANCKGKTRIYNAARLRYKESDRIEAMETELKKIGVDISSTENEIFIHGNENFLCDEELSGHKDHRIVMSLCVFATILNKPVVINEAEYIKKSYPDFFEDLKQCNVKVEYLYD